MRTEVLHTGDSSSRPRLHEGTGSYSFGTRTICLWIDKTPGAFIDALTLIGGTCGHEVPQIFVSAIHHWIVEDEVVTKLCFIRLIQLSGLFAAIFINDISFPTKKVLWKVVYTRLLSAAIDPRSHFVITVGNIMEPLSIRALIKILREFKACKGPWITIKIWFTINSKYFTRNSNLKCIFYDCRFDF